MTSAFSRRRLGLFWAVLVLGLGAGAATLQWLGPPAEPMLAAIPAEPAGGATPAVPAGTSTPAEPAGATIPAEPAGANIPAEPMRAGTPAEAAQANAPAVPAQPNTPAEPSQATAPAAPLAMQPPAPAVLAAATPASLPPATPAAAGAPAAPPPPPLAGPQTGATPPGARPAAAREAADPVIPPPDPEMLERSRHGMVPKLGPDGRTSIRAYARAFDRDADRRPRIGLVIGNLGLFAQHSEEAIARLPGAVTLAFSPYALRPEPLLERARARGMEVLVALPLEPAGFGQDADPGDRALLTSLSAEENLERLAWALSRIRGQVGAIGALGRLRGERFAANTDMLGIIQAALTSRGLLYVDPRPGAPTPARAFGRTVDLVLDDPSETRSEVERRLVELEALARRNGSALGLLGNPAPFFTAAILAWSAGLDERGAVLVPITVLLRRPASPAAQTPAGVTVSQTPAGVTVSQTPAGVTEFPAPAGVQASQTPDTARPGSQATR
ncbi:hypothetical protein HB662_10340 [Roseomonas frigidaquae]|uniref:Divergent polysaccharide deacetylase family protein n=1 Tax=Falsiroseomonas frigidaquae TaxID=487318 RepID=A0ABX1EYQ2_9PROT|nr:hypothetical protein [Falsiroseomonas frigidaquae]